MFGFNKNRELKEEVESLKKQLTLNRNYQITGFSNLTTPYNPSSLIETGYQGNATIFSLVDLLVKAASSVNPVVYEVKNERKFQEYKSLSSGMGNETSYLKAAMLQTEALKPVNNELYKLIKNPNPTMGYAEWVQEVLGFKYLTGNSFICSKKRSGTGKIFALEVWPAHLVQLMIQEMRILGYKVNAEGLMIEEVYENIGHIKNFNPDYNHEGGHLYGQSPLRAAFRNLQINNDAIDTGSNIIQQQGARGILYPDDPGTLLTEDQAKMLEDKHREKHTLQGRFGKNSGVMFPSMKMGWVNMSLPAGDLALLEQYNTSVKDLCGIYKVPSILLNDTAESKVESYREAKKYMYQQGVFPELIALRDEINRWLTPQYGKNLFVDFDFMSVPEIQEDMEKVTKQLNIAWWTTPNEKRQIMKMPKIDDDKMDDVYIPANLLNLNDGITGDLEGGDSET